MKLLNNYTENVWKPELLSKPKLRTYIVFKENYETELYLKLNIDRFSRSIVAQLRCGILALKVETGRYTGVELENRICELCKTEVENEEHFLFKCTALSQPRNNYLTAVNCDLSNLNITSLWKPENISQTMKFIVNLYNCRKNLLYNVS